MRKSLLVLPFVFGAAAAHAEPSEFANLAGQRLIELAGDVSELNAYAQAHVLQEGPLCLKTGVALPKAEALAKIYNDAYARQLIHGSGDPSPITAGETRSMGRTMNRLQTIMSYCAMTDQMRAVAGPARMQLLVNDVKNAARVASAELEVMVFAFPSAPGSYPTN